MIEFRMPSLGADMEDGTFVEWHVAPGEALRRGQVVCVVETQKGAIDVEVWEAGTVARLIAQPGQRIAVGQTMALLAGENEDWQAVARVEPTPAAPAVAPPPVATRQPTATAGPVASPPARASPAARKRAAELGIDLATVTTGEPGAAISIADVERAAASRVSGGADAMRSAIAAAMSRSKREIPHYYLGCEVDVEAAHRWLEGANAGRPIAERILFAAVALRAIALALREAPQLNGRHVGGRFEASAAIHIGVVTALRGGGLVVPTVHDADRLDLPALMGALREALSRARSGQLRSSDLADSTVTVSNLGDLGVETVYGVIYPPQVALIGLGRVAPRPVVHEGQVIAARTMHVTLAADHRASDGLSGARFLDALRQRLEQPQGM